MEEDTEVKDNEGKLLYTKPKETHTAYACAIEMRFNADKVIRQEKDWCIPATNTCLSNKDITLHNDITKVGLNDTLSKRTIDFTNRFTLLKHQPNTKSGFSATLFAEKKKQKNTESNKITYTAKYGYINYILAIRGTESKKESIK